MATVLVARARGTPALLSIPPQTWAQCQPGGGIHKQIYKAFQRRKSQAPPHMGRLFLPVARGGPAIKGLLNAFALGLRKRGAAQGEYIRHHTEKSCPPTWPPSWWRARGEPEERPGGPRVSIWGVPPNCLIEPLVVLVCLLAFPCGTLILVRLITCSRQRIYYTSYFLCRRQRIQESW